MFGSRNTIGATIMPATAPIAAASPQPSASIQPTRIPTRRAESGFCAAARIARPTGVKRKNRNTAASTTSVIPITPKSCGPMNVMPNGTCFGNGLGKGLMVYSQIQPAIELKIASRPMNTITSFSTPVPSTGRTTMRSTSTPPTNEIAIASRNAHQ